MCGPLNQDDVVLQSRVVRRARGDAAAGQEKLALRQYGLSGLDAEAAAHMCLSNLPGVARMCEQRQLCKHGSGVCTGQCS